ncbi:MAG: hypothetical protein ACLP5H_03650 [Desulfomonilaceae bacterium]
MKRLNVIRCLVISPLDVEAERVGIAETIERWNGQIGCTLEVLIQTVRWETHAAPELGANPQTLLNKQIVQDCDCAVAVFWSRLGTPTAKANSGSLEEIEEVLANGGHVMVYACKRDIPQALANPNQLARLKKALGGLRKRGLVFEYSDVQELQMLLMGHLTNTANIILQQSGERRIGREPDSVVPDIRIKTAWGVAPTEPEPRSLLSAEVQNHSTQPIHLATIQIESSDGRLMIPFRDVFFRPIEGRTTLEPGKSVQFYFDFVLLLEVVKKKKGARLRRVVVTDQVDHKFYSSEEDMEIAVSNFMKWTEKTRKKRTVKKDKK